ncbi:hypothetical protein AMAG_02925 [Allomyces macrogynus ATCC 38327]|uniref:DNA mismatch repair protein S5 domain-containing protein n=1 Tax=Allomyces macrogynus (strain ATCC 38327) TaxID=578462 RepID=A0A0L0S434_ALLM3|nr:hypothetical protein AMAG_02925 [Allomyces macrogynus ATCC 38327]|eukprot:KNE57180.1 hypothetical protein AMAG_02925 [Allomyces macrogynus ATCC 38327]
MADTGSTSAWGPPSRAPTSAAASTSTATSSHPARGTTPHVSGLPAATIRRLGAGQVITGVESAAKEPIENALDAGGTVISVHLIKHGAQSLVLTHVVNVVATDNGSGIAPVDFDQIAKRHHTSKIARYEVLESNTTLVPSYERSSLARSFGFTVLIVNPILGEALYSLAAVSEAPEITTKTKRDALATTLQLYQHGNVKSTKAAPGNVGTSLTVRALIFAFPERSEAACVLVKHKPDIKTLLHRDALAHPAVRFSLREGKKSWIKAASPSAMATLAAVYGRQVAAQCQELALPAGPDESWRDLAVLTNIPVHHILSGRPLTPIKAVTTALKPLFLAAFRAPKIFHVLNLHLDPHYYDENLDPSKATFVSELEPHLATCAGG